MTFRRLAINNVWGNRHQYGAYILSSIFSVMIFFMYAAFIFHPEVVHGNIQGGSGVRIALIGCEYVIIVFSFFFVLYSSSAFLKTRQKEFGLLLLFGFTRGKLRRLVTYENMLICLLSVAAGIGIGLLFSKLFFMALSGLLHVDNPLPFYFPLRAVAVTAIGYFLLFLAMTLFSLRRIGRSEIADLMQAGRKPKDPPKFSIWLVLLCVLSLGAGYGLAAAMNGQTVLVTMLPIIFLVVLGTYFLFSQASVALLNGLQRNKRIRYRGTNLLILSQLAYKMKDNARVLFLVSVLSAVILTSASTINAFYGGSKEQIVQHYPQAIGYVERGLDAHRTADPERVKQILREDGIRLEYELKLVGVPASFKLKSGVTMEGMFVSASDYNAQAARMKGVEPLEVGPGHAWFIYPYRESQAVFVRPGETLVFRTAAGADARMRMDGQRNGMIAAPVAPAANLVVVSDGDYRSLLAATPAKLQAAVYGFEWKGWESSEATVERIKALVPDDARSLFQSRTEAYREARQFSALTLFVALFVSALFFLASGSLLFFKMFTELQEDQAQFKALRRIGITRREMGRVVSRQTAILFYLPCAVGAVHAAFAMVALGNLLSMNVWLYAGTVLLIYLALQTLYCWTARRTYLRSIFREDAR